MKTRAEMQHELYKKYRELDDCKIFALKRAIGKFNRVPLQEEDLEFVAWKAFLETEEKYEAEKHIKSYEKFYRDCLYWRAKDYCLKYLTQKHQVCNYADTLDWSTDYKQYIEEPDDQKLLDRIAIRAYIEMNKHNEKGRVAKLFMLNMTTQLICNEIQISKTKLYRVIETVRRDLGRLVERQQKR